MTEMIETTATKVAVMQTEITYIKQSFEEFKGTHKEDMKEIKEFFADFKESLKSKAEKKEVDTLKAIAYSTVAFIIMTLVGIVVYIIQQGIHL